MTRPIGAGLLAHIAAGDGDLFDAVMIERRDGQRFGFSTRDVAPEIDLGDGDELYAGGVSVSALTLALGLDASSAEFRGPIGPTVTRAQLLGGAWDDAEAWFFRASPIASGIAPLLHGRIREAREEGEEFVFQLRGEADRLNQEIGDEITPYCRYKYGGAQCGVVVPAIPATVIDVDGTMRFTVSYAGSYPDGYFIGGDASFLTGAMAGDAAMEITAWGVGGALVLFEPLAAVPEIGDTLELRIGCLHTIEGCVANNNARRFGGEPDAPGSDKTLSGADQPGG